MTFQTGFAKMNLKWGCREMKQYAYHPMHMHIHTCFQPGASMAAHMHNARALGMRYIWFTDYDTRTGVKKNP